LFALHLLDVKIKDRETDIYRPPRFLQIWHIKISVPKSEFVCEVDINFLQLMARWPSLWHI